MVLDAFVFDVTFLAIVVAFVYYYYLPFQTNKQINNNVLLYVKIYIVVEINVYVVQMICNQKPRKYASEIDNNVL